ncbi:hypothetical protein C1I88_03535 [Akkermansia muciniphila]|nr:hypothetical protein C1I88_03535 [Akkermansia muciniphila]
MKLQGNVLIFIRGIHKELSYMKVTRFLRLKINDISLQLERMDILQLFWGMIRGRLKSIIHVMLEI